MKHIITLSLSLLILVGVTLSSCKDDKGLGSFTATIGGQSWSAIAPTGVKTGNRLTITGLSLDKQIVINISGTTVGSYDMSLIEGSIQPFVYTPNVSQQGAQQTYAGTSGTIEVTRIDDSRVSGTFSILAANTSMDIIQITGEFTDVKYF